MGPITPLMGLMETNPPTALVQVGPKSLINQIRYKLIRNSNGRYELCIVWMIYSGCKSFKKEFKNTKIATNGSNNATYGTNGNKPANSTSSGRTKKS